ncbi:flavodoxin family protein [Patescibacteria group bacterium]|nr:MAG: flavodoxin family protein [Patescibacteria group bacterium]
MPKKPLTALILEGGLNRTSGSSIEDLVIMTRNRLSKAGVRSRVIRLIGENVLPGLRHNEGKGDDWPKIARAIAACDILIMASPVWWGPGPSSLVQRALERMDAFDEEYLRTRTSKLYNKAAGVLTTGSEDGAQQVGQHIMNTLQFLGFAFPPESLCYWVGEVGVKRPPTRVRLAQNQDVAEMNRRFVRNLVILANLLRSKPFPAHDAGET